MSQDQEAVMWMILGYVIPKETIVGQGISLIVFIVAAVLMISWMLKK